MKLNIYLKGSFKTVKVKPISNPQRKLLTNFQNYLEILYKYFSNKDYDKVNYKNFKKELEPYKEFPFSEDIFYEIKAIDKEIRNINKSRKQVKTVTKGFNSKLKGLTNSLFKGNVKSFIAKAEQMDSINQSIIKASQSRTAVVKHIRNPLERITNILSHPTGVLKDFSLEDMKDVYSVDLNKFKYSYLNFPKNKLNDFEYLVIFIQRLRNKKNATRISYEAFEEYSDFLYQKKENWGKLKEKVKKFLYDNDKKLIITILKELDEFPELKATNEKLKKEIKEVYRGVPGKGSSPNKKNIDEILDTDKKSKYTSTSKWYGSAENFAKQKGHLFGPRNSKWGLVIIYKVTPSNIILDTEIFGSVFEESEVIVNTSKAKVKEYNVV